METAGANQSHVMLEEAWKRAVGRSKQQRNLDVPTVVFVKAIMIGYREMQEGANVGKLAA